MQLLISGAEQGSAGSVGKLAVLTVIDFPSGEVLHQTEYLTPDALRTDEHKVQFTGFCWWQDKLHVCTHSEIVVFDTWPPTKPAYTISDPGFNDLHHCLPFGEHLVVSNTGLETVDLLDPDGKLVERYDLLANEPEARTIDPAKDYRLVPDTKPHLRHGNHIFIHEGQLWTSQLKTHDAVCVTDPTRRLEMRVGAPHDGDFHGERLSFTTTNGHLVFFNQADDRSHRAIDLNPITPHWDQLGWCRGIVPHPTEPGHALVMFSSLRRSKWRDFGYFIKHGHSMPFSRVAQYDLENQAFIQEVQVGPGLGYQLFQLHVLDPQQELPAP